jgi:hypothetical protein
MAPGFNLSPCSAACSAGMDETRSPPSQFLLESESRGGESGLVAGLDFKSSGVHRKVGSVGSIPMRLRHGSLKLATNYTNSTKHHPKIGEKSETSEPFTIFWHMNSRSTVRTSLRFLQCSTRANVMYVPDHSGIDVKATST